SCAALLVRAACAVLTDQRRSRRRQLRRDRTLHTASNRRGTPLADMPGMQSRHVARSVALSVALSIGLASAARAEEVIGAPAHLPETDHFTIDPVVDGVLVAGGITFSELLGLILSTGEIRPTQPGDPNVLLSIDRVAVTQTIDPNAGTRSTVGLYAAYGYAVLDPILSGVRDGRRALLADAILYAES